MGEKMKNCWCFMTPTARCKSVWAVCNKCERQDLSRKEYWVRIVPDVFDSLDDLTKVLRKQGKIIVKCKQGIHDIEVERTWFAKKGLKEPEP